MTQQQVIFIIEQLNILPKDELTSISQAIRERIQQMNNLLKFQFSVGDRVEFEKRGAIIKGTIIRLNPKTASLRTEGHGNWRVGYGHLQKSEQAGEKSR